MTNSTDVSDMKMTRKWIPWFRNCEKCYVSAAEFCALKNLNFYEKIIGSKIT